jgi:hypothetical protein
LRTCRPEPIRTGSCPHDLRCPSERISARERLKQRGLQFQRALTNAEYRTLGEWLRDYPNVLLRAYGSYDGSITNLDFLQFFPTQAVHGRRDVVCPGFGGGDLLDSCATRS